jgi:4a-hydroxytetrahydrobiopterin dehydratase
LIEGWTLEGNALVREFSFRDFGAAIAFLDEVVRKADDFGRRPDVRLSWNRVRLIVRNLNHAGLTDAELRLAAKVNAAVAEQLGPAPPPVPELAIEGDVLVAKG